MISHSCDLLSNSYLCFSNNSLTVWHCVAVAVVICFQIPIFALAITVKLCQIALPYRCDLLSNSYLCFSNNSLRVSLNSRSSVVICFQIPIFALAITVNLSKSSQVFGCDLLSNSYLCFSNNSIPFFPLTTSIVVICFQIPIFALAITVLKQNVFLTPRCDLLSNSYLCFSNNSRKRAALAHSLL